MNLVPISLSGRMAGRFLVWLSDPVNFVKEHTAWEGGATAYHNKNVCIVSVSERKVSLFETWAYDIMVHDPTLILINLGGHVF